MKRDAWGRMLVAVQIVLVGVIIGALAGMRFSMITWRPALMIVGGAVLGMAVIGFIGLLTIYVGFRGGRRGGVRPCMLAAALSAIPILFVLVLGIKSREVPPIHDISTDTVNPPVFRTLAGHRQEGENSPDYAGEEVAQLQQEAYQKVKPLYFQLPVDKVYAKALDAVDGIGWMIVETDPVSGHIEAVDTTALLKFQDDIVIRITPEQEGGSRLDIRSASRVGVSDFGTNASRIEKFLNMMETRKK